MTGRDERGRFLKGGPGGPGRKPLDFSIAAREALLKHITEPEIAGLLVARARRDTAALKLLCAYVWGDPVQAVDVTTNGESVNFSIQAVDYRTGMDALAPRPVGDSNAPGQDEGADGGA